MSDLTNSEATPNAISSPASADGATRSASPAGPTLDLFGLEAAPASLSAPPASSKARKTTATSGPSSSGSSASRALTRFLASRLQTRLATTGSTMFRQTWREKVTPSGRSYWAHTASVLRTSGNGCGSWPTPMAGTPAQNGNNAAGNNDSSRKTVALANWPTPVANDNKTPEAHLAMKDRMGGGRKEITSLQVMAKTVSPWATPSSRDWKDSPGMAAIGTNPDGTERTRLDQIPRQVQLVDSGIPPTGSPAATEKPGRLNPAHSRWLMGYPPGWDACAAMVTPLSRRLRRK